MNKIFKLIRSKMIDAKIFIGRTMSWIGMANSLMLVFLVIERLNNLGVIKGDLGNSLIFVIIAWFCLLVLLGWIEVKKIKAPHLEAEKMLEFNPPFKFMYDKIREIDLRTKRIEERVNQMGVKIE